MFRHSQISIIMFLLSFLMNSTTSSSQSLETVPSVDLKKYAGKWYEIASFPQVFQKGCQCTTAEYSLDPQGFIVVENRCHRNGKVSYIKGKATVDQNSGNAKLKVQFFWPFKGKYWIIELASDYSYAVVGHPNRKYLWILSRTPKMNESLYQDIVDRAKRRGFDTNLLKPTDQNCQ